MPVSSQRGVVMKLASTPARSVKTTLSRSKPPASRISRFTVSCAVSHMLRQAMTVTTGLPLSSRRPAALFRNAVAGPAGARNHTW